MPVDKEGVLLKKNPFAPSSRQVGIRQPLGKPELLQFHFKQLPLRGQKSRLDGLPGVNRLHRSAVGFHLHAQLRQVLRCGI